MAKYTITGLPKKKKFEDGGFIEMDLPKEAIQEYVNRGYTVEEVDEYSDGGIFRRRRRREPEPTPDYTAWSGTTPQLVQPGEDPFALPTNTPLPAAEFEQPEFMFPDWTPEQIDAYYREKEAYDAKMARKNAYAPAALTYKDLARPQGYFVLGEDMTETFLKELKNNGFYAKKTKEGDYEVFSNKDIADLIYKKGLNPNELSTKLDLGSAKELKSYFDPIYQNASMIHAKRNKEKIDLLVKQGYDKDAAIAKLVREGEGTTAGLNSLYGSYTKAAYDKKQAEAKALLAAGAADPDKLTEYQKQMYLNIQNFADKEFQEKVQSANDQVSSWGKWDIQPAESTAIRNKAGYTDPMTGEYVQGDNTTAWERNESAKANALSALENYNATTAMQAQAAREILESNQLTDEQRKQFLENPKEFNKILEQYVNYTRAPQGENTGMALFNDPYVRIYPGREKSDFNVGPQGAQWTPGTYERRQTIDGPVEMVYPEKYLIGPGGGLLGGGFRGLTRTLEYAPISAAPWLTAGNALNLYMGYETVKPGGLISQSIQGFKEDDKLKGWGNAGMSALNLLPFVGPTMKGMEYLNALGKTDNAAQFEGIHQAGIGNWFKPSSSASSVIDDISLKTLKANNYQGASDDLLTKIIQKKKGDVQKGTWNSQMTPDEEMVLTANKDRVKQLLNDVEAPPITPPVAPTGFLGKTYDKGKNLITGTAGKIGTGTSNAAKNWWNATKTDMANASWLERFAPLRPTSGLGTTTTSTAATAAQNTTKYQTIDEIAQAMYGSNYDDLASGLAKAQVDKAFKAQPLPSGASTSGQGAASTVTSVSDDIILKNKIANEKYGVDYDKLTGWAPSVVDKEFQAAKTLQQEAAATNQAKNAAQDSGTWGDWVNRNNIMGGLGVTAYATGDNENSDLMLAGLPFAFMSRGKINLSPDKLKYLRLASTIGTEASPLKTSAVLSADANNIKSFIEGSAFNKGLTGASKQTEGAFNMGVFNVKNDPNFIIKLEHPATVGAQRAMPEYANINMAEAMQNISGPTFGKVHHQVVSPTTGNRALILNKLEGAPYNELTMDDYLNLSDDAIVKFHDDVQTLKRNNLGFDFTGNNYMFDRNTNQFKLFDIDPHMTQFDPNHQHVYDFFQTQVYGGGNPMLFGSKQAGLNLQNALKRRFDRDLMLKMNEAGMSDTDMRGINDVYQQRLNYLFRGLNYEKDGGSIEMDVDPDMVETLLAQGYNVEQM